MLDRAPPPPPAPLQHCCQKDHLRKQAWPCHPGQGSLRRLGTAGLVKSRLPHCLSKHSPPPLPEGPVPSSKDKLLAPYCPPLCRACPSFPKCYLGCCLVWACSRPSGVTCCRKPSLIALALDALSFCSVRNHEPVTYPVSHCEGQADLGPLVASHLPPRTLQHLSTVSTPSHFLGDPMVPQP